MKPENMPWQARAIERCQGAWAAAAKREGDAGEVEGAQEHELAAPAVRQEAPDGAGGEAARHPAVVIARATQATASASLLAPRSRA